MEKKGRNEKGHFVKGSKISGRPKGVENKQTKDIKEAYKKLIEANLDNMVKWLEEIAKDEPYKAIQIMQGLSEYVVPKLARSEQKIEHSNAEKIEIEIVKNESKNND